MPERVPRRANDAPDLILDAVGLIDWFRTCAAALEQVQHPEGTPTSVPSWPSARGVKANIPPLIGGRIAADGLRLRSGTCSAEILLDEALSLLDLWEPTLKSITLDLRDRARGQARRADHELAAGHDRGPLHGIPIAVKDLLDVAGLRTSAGSCLTVGHRATQDAAAVHALEQAGAVLIAKSNTHEYAFGALTPPTRNPRDSRCMPGGSSGGSGALVGAGVVAAAVGTDTAGSIREPAAMCGAVGLKPTAGRVSNAGVVPLSWSLDTVGPIGSSVADTACLFAGLGPAASLHDDEPSPPSLEGLRVAVWGTSFHRLQGPVRNGLERGLELLADAGAVFQTVTLGEPDDLVAATLVLLGAEALAFHAPQMHERRDEYEADVIAYLDLSATFTGVDVVNAQRVRRRFTERVDAALDAFDVILTPAQIVLPPRLTDIDVELEDGRRAPRDLSLIRTLAAFNLSGHPALSLPVALDGPTGHTISMQLVAGHGRDRWLLGIGAHLETIVGPISAPSAHS